MSWRIARALLALLAILPLGGCLGLGATAVNVVWHAAAAAPLVVGAAGAYAQMSAEERACASMTLAERGAASVGDRMRCERVWASGAQPVSMTAPVQPDPQRSCESFRRAIERQVIDNANRPHGAPIQWFFVHSSDADRCGLRQLNDQLRSRYPGAFR
jgi:hypothetical protein